MRPLLPVGIEPGCPRRGRVRPNILFSVGGEDFELPPVALWPGEALEQLAAGACQWDTRSIVGIAEVADDVDQAIEHSRRAIETWRRVGDRRGEGIALDNIAECYRKAGDYQNARTYYVLGIEVFREIDDLWGEGVGLAGLGRVQQHLGDLADAVATLEASLDVRRRIGDKWGQSDSLHCLGLVLQDCGRTAEARMAWTRALVICEEVADPLAEEIRALLVAAER
ncbi:tetratricopeptide repeat protein [Kutzneria sp. NPDC052558]|uniref:tetratricopeptide repeat protein n=1 Tax=Kutzneria sp. NPDC052558 TaxID=3364121 RepID=UPI0037CC73F8